MSQTEQFTERDEVEMLLPWFVTGKLDAADRAKVEAFLAKEPAMRRQLDLIREEQGVSIAANEAVALPRTLSVASGMDYVVAHSPFLQARNAGSGVIAQIRSFFSQPSARPVRYAAIAAAAVIALQAAAIGSLWHGAGTPSAPELASGENAVVSKGTFATVKFRDGVSFAAVQSALADLDMRIADGPQSGGLFTVRLSAGVLNADERAAKVSALRQRSDIIQMVLPRPQP